MRHRIVSVQITSILSLVSIRDRSRQIAELFGLEEIQRTRFTTAISEIARNAIQYAQGGTLTFFVGEASSAKGVQCVSAEIIDTGPGIDNVALLVNARHPSLISGGVGIPGTRRLVDDFWIESVRGDGTQVGIEMYLPREVPLYSVTQINEIVGQMARKKPQTPIEAIEQQNHEMLLTLDELRRSKAELEVADDRKNEFLAMLAHELRNPLAAISLSLELGAKTGNTKDAFAVIGRQTAHLSRLVADLLDVSRVTRGKVDLRTEIADLNAIVAGAIEMTYPEFERRGHSIAFTPPASPVIVRVDVARMKQVFGNILHNAARYTPQSDKVSINITVNDSAASVTVEDNGMGISPLMLPRVFDLFAQEFNNVNRQEAGLGIGLTLVQRLVSDHGGHVSAYSAGTGTGSRFTVELPIVNESLPKALAPTSLPPLPTGLTVMLVDDNQDAVSALAALLELEGCTCLTAYDGASALALNAKHPAQVYIIDIGLPDMTGFDLSTALRQAATQSPQRYPPRATHIALSGYSSKEFHVKASEVGFDHYFSKPLPIDGMLSILTSL
ncbi:ATPase [Robbsia andropogonis]|uniref:histidine kinase n=1 Tax=Robbsia andropogonis TaxID=28092 RepID=A0A0F5JW61_9BURK|nr:ATP-binding protein [Robbsia andropogonis]KKB61940.1 ATPase [Robbsia andropogonis]MCP1120791.1 ATP-binding protein [Robbsia andropogonis]MCP1130534.1 ATP-binding protein [Robbsia andropogonis]